MTAAQVHRELYASLIRLGLAQGRVATSGDPVVGVAVWLVRPPLRIAGSPPAMAGTKRQLPAAFPAHAADRVERYSAVIRQLRERARPDRHAYLDTLAVLPEHRRRGIASRLLETGHAWADAARLPCALDTETAQNVAFYEHRGYQVVARLQVPSSDLIISAMRRAPSDLHTADERRRGCLCRHGGDDQTKPAIGGGSWCRTRGWYLAAAGRDRTISPGRARLDRALWTCR